MSDEKKDDKKDDKKDPKAAAATPPPGGGLKAKLGPVVAVIMLIGIGAAIGSYAATTFLSPPADAGKPGAHGGGGHGDGKGDGNGGAAGDEHGGGEAHSLLHSAIELDLGNLTSNIIGQAGKRYIKMEVTLWLNPKLSAATAGGGHGGGPSSLIKLLKSQLESHLKTYLLTDLDTPAVTAMIDKDFADIADRELRQLFPAELKGEGKVVHKVVLTNLLMQ